MFGRGGQDCHTFLVAEKTQTIDLYYFALSCGYEQLS